MRIEDTKRIPYEPAKPVKQEDAVSVPSSPNLVASNPDVSRTDRIEKLKQMFSEGRPIDVNKLADKLMESGIFFNEKA